LLCAVRDIWRSQKIGLTAAPILMYYGVRGAITHHSKQRRIRPYRRALARWGRRCHDEIADRKQYQSFEPEFRSTISSIVPGMLLTTTGVPQAIAELFKLWRQNTWSTSLRV
jgi:hypothetical protein